MGSNSAFKGLTSHHVLQSHPNLHTKRSSIQSNIPTIPDVVLIQLILLMMGTWLPETCRE